LITGVEPPVTGIAVWFSTPCFSSLICKMDMIVIQDLLWRLNELNR
jgi:hypothetical protein